MKNKLIKNSGTYKYVLITFVTALFMFLPFILSGLGIFYHMGDFNAQQIPFYTHCHEIVRSGKLFSWDWGVELGTDFFSSNTYYTLCSPFFWLTIPFPTSAVPYLMGPLLILKFMCATGTAYLYISRFTKTTKAAFMGALLYAFSGWSIYNVFYNQFHESLIVFPLMLLALEKLVEENKRGLFAFAVAISAIVNYYFFIGMVVFVVIYWLIKTMSKAWDMSFKKFFYILLEGILGTAAAAVVLIPSALAVFSMSRTTGVLMNGVDLLVYPDSSVYLCVLQAIFFPPEITALQSFNDVEGVAWQSLSLWLPFVGMMGVFAWIKNKRKHWAARILLVSFVMMLVPGLNAIFTLLQPIYYARWFMMPILIMALVTAIGVEEFKMENYKSSYKAISVITLAYIAITAFLPTVGENGELLFGIYNRNDSSRFYLFLTWSFMAALQLLFMYNFFGNGRMTDKKPVHYMKKIIPAILVCALTVSIITFSIAQSSSGGYKAVQHIKDFTSASEVFDDAEDYRVSFVSGEYNQHMYIKDASCINGFHSVVGGATSDFYKTAYDFDRNVVSPDHLIANDEYYKALTSVKYLFVEKVYVDDYEKNFSDTKDYNASLLDSYKEYGYALNPGYEKFNEGTDYIIYENKYYIPMGLKYNYYISEKDFENIKAEDKTAVLLKALVVSEDNISKVSNILKNYYPLYKKDVFSDESYFELCEAHKSLGCSSFEKNKNGFEAKFESDNEEIIMFSVPFTGDDWTAKINGEKTEIISVDGGLMAVKVPAGESTITFTYRTPGATLGIAASAVSFAAILIVLFSSIIYSKRKNGVK